MYNMLHVDNVISCVHNRDLSGHFFLLTL